METCLKSNLTREHDVGMQCKACWLSVSVVNASQRRKALNYIPASWSFLTLVTS